MDIQTTTGSVRGFKKDHMIQYLGIPYAEAPLGDLRYKRAVSKKPWDGVLSADRVVDRCTQMNMGEISGSEDCLYLNIRCPETVEHAGEFLPVLFWIHGGGYNTGGMTDEISDGTCFVRDGVIFVEIQYRLNVTGFFDFTVIPGCEWVETNRGLSDMVEALRWTYKNIRAFGGDPRRITIMGESAGGAAVTTLMAVPAVKGMFSQVISESSLPNCVQPHHVAKTLIYAIMEKNGWKEEDMPAIIRGDVKELLLAAEYIQASCQDIEPGTLLPCPCIDDLLPEYPVDAIRKGSAEGVRLILGTNQHEGTMFINDFMHVFPNSWEMIREMFAKNGSSGCFERVKRYYDCEDARFPGEISPFVNFGTDYAFHVPGVELAAAQASHGETYLYTYEFVAEGAREAKMYASHAFEMAFVFESYDTPMPAQTLDTTSDLIKQELAKEIHGSWLRFIKGEIPHEEWPVMTGYHTPVRIFDEKTYTRIDDLNELMKLWEGLIFFR